MMRRRIETIEKLAFMPSSFPNHIVGLVDRVMIFHHALNWSIPSTKTTKGLLGTNLVLLN